MGMNLDKCSFKVRTSHMIIYHVEMKPDNRNSTFFSFGMLIGYKVYITIRSEEMD